MALGTLHPSRVVNIYPQPFHNHATLGLKLGNRCFFHLVVNHRLFFFFFFTGDCSVKCQLGKPAKDSTCGMKDVLHLSG